MARKCLFCGGQANSKEHAFPAWLNDVAPGSGQMVHQRSATGDTWTTAGFDVQVRQVCKKCNETWMSRLETDAQDFVTPFALRQRTHPLGHAEQIKLSTWLYKTGIMLALAYPEEERFVPEDDYRFFAEHMKPPDGTSIWIAGLVPELRGVEGEGMYRTGWTKPERLEFFSSGRPMYPNGYRLSFSVIALICQIMRDPHGGRFERAPGFSDVWTRIRPISKGAWPPGRWISAAGLEDIVGGNIYPRRV